MTILLDENLPEGLIELLRRLGHQVDSIGSPLLKGLENGRLYREVAARYDLFFTKDREFVSRIAERRDPMPVRVVLVVIPQQPQRQFVAAFLDAFAQTNRSSAASHVADWPRA